MHRCLGILSVSSANGILSHTNKNSSNDVSRSRTFRPLSNNHRSHHSNLHSHSSHQNHNNHHPQQHLRLLSPLRQPNHQQQLRPRAPSASAPAGYSSSVAARHTVLAVEEYTLAAGTDASYSAHIASSAFVPRCSSSVSVGGGSHRRRCSAFVRLRSGSMLHYSPRKSLLASSIFQTKGIRSATHLAKSRPAPEGLLALLDAAAERSASL